MKNYNVGVVSLLYGENYEAADDLVAGYITAMLRRDGYCVDIIEIEQGKESEGLNRFSAKDYQVVVFTIPTSSNIPELINFSNFVKQNNRSCKVVWAGWDHHSAPIDVDAVISSCEAIDAIIRGEGEMTVVDLIRAFHENRSLGACAGITFRDGKEIIDNDDRPPIANLDELPYPARDTHFQHSYNSFRISTARGCLGNCAFCPVPPGKIKGSSPWRGRSPENVVAELRELVNTSGVKHFMFIDPTFEDPGIKGKERIRKIAELIIDANLEINFLVNMRAENWTDADRDLLALLYQAGLESVTVGFEAGNDRSLRLFNKRAKISDFFTFIRLMKDFNIYLAYGFIMFHPYSAFEDLNENNDFLKEAGVAHMMGAYLIRLKAFPMTQIYQKLLQDNLIKKPKNGIYTLFDYRYRDPRIQKLAEKMAGVEQQLNAQPDIHFYNVQKFTTFASRLRRKLMRNGIIREDLLGRLTAVENAIEELKNVLNEANHSWFSQCIDWVRQDQPDIVFDDILAQHYQILRLEMNKLKTVQMKHGRELIKFLNYQG